MSNCIHLLHPTTSIWLSCAHLKPLRLSKAAPARAFIPPTKIWVCWPLIGSIRPAMWWCTIRTGRGKTVTPWPPSGMGKNVKSRVYSRGFCVEPHMNNIGVACKMRLRHCWKHVSHGRINIVAFDKYVKSEVNKKWSDEGSMELLGSKCNEVVNRHSIGLSISIFELWIIKVGNHTFWQTQKEH